ncbi:MAG: phosphate ABC transporter permease subunit PstC, partial [Brevundimonas sp.]
MLIWVALLAIIAFSAVSYRLGKAKAVRISKGVRTHSRPNYLGAYVALWAGVPAAILLALFIMFGGRVEHAWLSANPPAVVKALPSEQAEVFYSDAVTLSKGKKAQGFYEGELKAALDVKAKEAKSQRAMLTTGVMALAALLALAGMLIALPRITVDFRGRNRVETWIRGILIACSAVAVLTTL